MHKLDQIEMKERSSATSFTLRKRKFGFSSWPNLRSPPRPKINFNHSLSSVLPFLRIFLLVSSEVCEVCGCEKRQWKSVYFALQCDRRKNKITAPSERIFKTNGFVSGEEEEKIEEEEEENKLFFQEDKLLYPLPHNFSQLTNVKFFVINRKTIKWYCFIIPFRTTVFPLPQSFREPSPKEKASSARFEGWEEITRKAWAKKEKLLMGKFDSSR